MEQGATDRVILLDRPVHCGLGMTVSEVALVQFDFATEIHNEEGAEPRALSVPVRRVFVGTHKPVWSCRCGHTQAMTDAQIQEHRSFNPPQQYTLVGKDVYNGQGQVPVVSARQEPVGSNGRQVSGDGQPAQPQVRQPDTSGHAQAKPSQSQPSAVSQKVLTDKQRSLIAANNGD